MLSARRQGYHIEGAFVGGRQHNRGGASCAVGPMPIHGSNAPAVAGDESGRPVLRYRCREVVADRALVLQELASHNGASGVRAESSGPVEQQQSGQKPVSGSLAHGSGPPSTLRSGIGPISRSPK